MHAVKHYLIVAFLMKCKKYKFSKREIQSRFANIQFQCLSNSNPVPVQMFRYQIFRPIALSDTE